MARELHGTYGTCYIQDCREGLPDLSHKQFDLTVTDPPYNMGTKQCSGMNDSAVPREVLLYEDGLSTEAYEQMLREWFGLNKMVSEYLIFTCGKTNLGFWMNFEPIFRDQYAIWQIPNSQSRGKISQFLGFEPILFWGDFKHRKVWDRDVFSYYLNNGFMRLGEFGALTNPDPSYLPIHPHPKPHELWLNLIIRYRPRNVLDCFGGSGLTARICEMYQIPWVIYEQNPAFIPDIEWNIRVGQANPRSYPKRYQKATLKSFVGGTHGI